MANGSEATVSLCTVHLMAPVGSGEDDFEVAEGGLEGVDDDREAVDALAAPTAVQDPSDVRAEKRRRGVERLEVERVEEIAPGTQLEPGGVLRAGGATFGSAPDEDEGAAPSGPAPEPSSMRFAGSPRRSAS